MSVIHSDILSLQSRLNHVQWVCDYSGQCPRGRRAYEIPKDGVLSVPGLQPGAQVLIDADYGRCEGDVHEHCDRVRPVKGLDAALFFDYVSHALNSA